MNERATEVAVIGLGLAYLVVLTWAIGNISYDIWGALVAGPVYALIGVAVIRRLFRGPLEPLVVPLMWGLLVKFLGSLARYWVGFEAYEGGIDAARYHRFGGQLASAVWSGEERLVAALPHDVGTQFTENFTAFVYVLTGPSQLAGFLTFSLLAYLGLALMVKAAAIAVPGLAARRYAWLCVLFPSVVYWPASIGKESMLMLGLGVATLGIATMLTHGRWVPSIAMIVAGLGFTALVRPHIAGIWVAGAFPALVVALLRRSRPSGGAVAAPGANRFGVAVVLVLAAVGLAVISSVTIRFLAPDAEERSTTDSLTQILESTTARTDEGGSSFVPPSLGNPTAWPYASVRTLTRPLLPEVRNPVEFLTAAETTALLGLLVVNRRRLYNIPRLLVTSPYVTFVVTTIFLTGLAYSSFANLGLLARQKSLIFPFMLLLACVPERPWRRTWKATPAVADDRSAQTPPAVHSPS